MASIAYPNGNGVTLTRSPYTAFQPYEGSPDASISNLLFAAQTDWGEWGFKWGEGLGAAATLTTSFASSHLHYHYTVFGPPPSPVGLFSQAQQNAAWTAMQLAASVARITFVQVSDSGSSAGDIRWANTGDAIAVPTAETQAPPVVYSEAGDIWVGPEIASMAPTRGGAGFVYIHELGHALGLWHPHQGIVAAEPGEDQLKYSVMSYRDFEGDSVAAWDSEFLPTSFMLNDILALQFLYGANTNHLTGATTYQWAEWEHIYETIWDGGGTDTIDASSQRDAVLLNLNSGEWSEIGVAFHDGQATVRDRLTIAYGTVIENAVGSRNDDTIIGNAHANRLDGGVGSDTLEGGLGNDTYVVDQAGDVVVEVIESGVDTVESWISYELGMYVENLTLIGTAAAAARGNAQDNALQGNSAANVLEGGAGNDLYRFARGGGDDEVLDASGVDRIVFEGVSSEQVSVLREGDLIVLRVTATDSIRFADAGGNYCVEEFEFSDGLRSAAWLNEQLSGPPTGVDATLVIDEDTPYVLRLADFGYTSTDGSTSPAAVRFDGLPLAGTLTLSGVALTLGTVVAAADIGSGALVFTPAVNGHGNAHGLITFTVQSPSGTFDPVANTLTFNVTPVNDAPFGADRTVAMNEDGFYFLETADFSFSDVDAGNYFGGIRVDVLPVAGTLVLNGRVATVGQEISATELANGLNYFRPAPNANGAGYASFSYSVRDQAGTYSAASNVFTVDVASVNDTPAGADKSIVMPEDTTYTLTLADFGFSDVDSQDTLAAVRFDTISIFGPLKLNGAGIASGQLVDAADIAAGALTLTPFPNGSGSGYASYTFSVRDQGGAFDATPNGLTFYVTPASDPPAGADKTITLPEDGSYKFILADFGFSDPDVGNSFASLRIETLPLAGSLTLNGVAVTAGELIAAADIAGGKFVFLPTPNQNGAGYANFTFSVQDSTGVFDPSPNLITLDVTAVNDQPSGTDKTIATSEDTNYTFAAEDFGYSDLEGHDFTWVRIEDLPHRGSLKLNGIGVTAGQLVSISDVSAGKLVFTPAVDANGVGYTSITFLVRDQLGATDSSPNRLTFDVTAVNDTPVGSDRVIAFAEDSSYVMNKADFGFVDADAGDSFSEVRIETAPAAGLLTLNGLAVVAGQIVTVAQLDAGALVFTPAPNANGNAYASWTFSVRDTAGSFDPTANRVTFDVGSVNDTPSGTDSTVTLNEDSVYTMRTADFGFTDVDTPDSLNSVRFDTLPTSGTLRLNGVNVTAGQVVFMGDIAADKLVYVPANNQNGTGYAYLTFSVKDNFGSFDPSANSLTFNVTPVNDAPTGLAGIQGTASLGRTLVATSTLTDVDGLGVFSYQWLRGTTAIAGATGSEYTLVSADVGQSVSVRITYLDGGGTLESRTSSPTAPVAGPNGTGTVTISGTQSQKSTLTAGTGTLADPDGLGTLSFQWFRGGVAIAEANANTYTLTQGDVGQRISVQVSYVDGGGMTESRVSAQTNPISNVNDLPTGIVRMLGDGRPRDTLTADPGGLADADGLGVYSYQWFRGTSAISGATDSSYTLTASDEGALISVRVRYTDGFGKVESVTSASMTAGRTFNGSNAGNNFTGTAGADLINGNGGNDTLKGAGGNDLITGGAGNDIIDGGAGVDVASYSGNRASYSVSFNTTTLAATVVGGSGEGTDKLTTVERLKFSDVALALDLNANAGLVAKAVGAVFGASFVSNAARIGEGLDLVDAGMTEAQLITFQAGLQLGQDHTHTAFVQLIWNNVYGRAATAEEEAYWVAQLDTGVHTEGSMGVIFAESAENAANINLTGLAQTGIEYVY